MRKLIAVVLTLLPLLAHGAGGNTVPLDKAGADVSNQASLQRGARLFVNYCLSCHSASYMRYNRLSSDLGLEEDQVMDNLMFSGDKIGNTMKVALQARDAQSWFGTKVPDLSVIARSRTPDWLYTYLRGFYQDDSRPYGVNNIVFKDVGMPHVMSGLQGIQKAVFKTETDASGHEHQVFDGFEQVTEGSMTPAEFDRAMRDLVNYLVYMGEPALLERKALGAKVLIFLIIFFLAAYALKKNYWKDVH